jgi:hypothetical protein
MPTLILTPRYSEDSQALWRVATHLGWRVERLVNWRLSDDLKRASEPVLYLEALMAEAIAQQLGVHLLNPSNDWLPNLPEEYRKRWVYLSTLGEHGNQKSKLLSNRKRQKFSSARVMLLKTCQVIMQMRYCVSC